MIAVHGPIIMKDATPTIPVMVTFMAGCLIFLGIVFINVSAQSSSPPPTDTDLISVSKEIFLWVVASAGAISLFVSIGYGFFKKQKYENLEKDRDEWKGLAESREERIKELKYTHSEEQARLNLTIATRGTSITNLQESNGALVSVSLQMKAILRKLRLGGVWQGHEERIHEIE